MININTDVKKVLNKNIMFKINLILFIIISLSWLYVKPFQPDLLTHQKHFWSSQYVLLSVFGSIFGIVISKYWGGYKSILGRAILAFSIGLLLQSFGQIVYNSYTVYAKIEAPYPSFGDIGYFLSIPAYIYGVILLGRVSGVKISFKLFVTNFLAALLPISMLIFSYHAFLQDYSFVDPNLLTVFLDFGYPLGQAIYVSFALLILLLCRNKLTGVMKKPIILILLALIIQYICDFNFLYQANRGTWYAGSVGDLGYAFSYFVMTFALINIGKTFIDIQRS